ncbi:MAG: prolyl oligopeptidase family serine peptidase [Anaerolineales bacterium]|nr:prolyl oligopeptidase family serine peptidase [Anaerolineales bacterium]
MAKRWRSWRYWWRLTRLFLILGVLAGVLTPVVGGFVSMWILLHPDCSTHETLTPTPPNIESFELTARAGGSFKGYYVPSTNGATIIFPPAYSSSSRASRWNEAKVLWRHGYGIVLYEARRCADMGAVSLGYQEVSEIEDVIVYLRERGDVDMAHLGIHGFSTGGAGAIMAAARYPELRSIVAEGGYANMQTIIDNSSVDAPLLFTLWRWSMQITYQQITGNSIDDLDTLEVIADIAPRPILLIYGSKESSLPEGYRQLKAAGDNAELWVVEGSGHGGYIRAAPDEYEQRVVAFFDHSLLN